MPQVIGIDSDGLKGPVNVVAVTDIDDTPVDGVTVKPISSNWAYDKVVSDEIEIEALAQVWQFKLNAASAVTYTANIRGINGKVVTVDWGDGDEDDYTLLGAETDVAISHTYTKSTAVVRIKYAQYLTYYINTTHNNTYFDLADLPSGMTDVYITGSNTVSGDLADLPSGMTYVRITGSNTISGDLADLPSGVTFVYIYGSNTISGDLADLPSGITEVLITGSNTISGYTSPRAWASNMSYYLVQPTGIGGLDSTEVDNLLIDLDNSLGATQGITVNLTGTNAARTSASDTAVANLIARKTGNSVSTN